MFKFSNIKKLFSYKWGELVKNIVPKGNIMATIEEEEYKNINNGAIVRIIAVAFSKLATIGLAVWIVVKAYSAFYGDEIMSYAISTVLSENAGEYIVDIITAAILPIGLLIYNIIMKHKKQSYWVYFIVLIYALIQTAYSVFGIFGWLGSLLVSPIFALVGLASIFLIFLGNVHIAVGCVDFCLKNKPATFPNQNNQNVGSYQPNSQINSVEPVVGSYQPNQQSVAVTPTENYQPVAPVTNAVPNQNEVQPVVENYQQPVAPTINNEFTPQTPVTNVVTPNIENINNQTTNMTGTTVPELKYCPRCGRPIVVGTVICPSCNNQID